MKDFLSWFTYNEREKSERKKRKHEERKLRKDDREKRKSERILQKRQQESWRQENFVWKIKKTCFRCAFFFIVIYLIIITCATVAEAVIPMFSAETDVSGLKNLINSNSTFLGLASFALAIFSIYQAFNGEKTNKKMLENLEDIHHQVEHIYNDSHVYGRGGKNNISPGNGSDDTK